MPSTHARLSHNQAMRQRSGGRVRSSPWPPVLLRVLGAVEAGLPSPAEEALGDILSLDEFLIRNKEATYLLTVTGDSMIESLLDQLILVYFTRGRIALLRKAES